jgi:hypothetical protein
LIDFIRTSSVADLEDADQEFDFDPEEVDQWFLMTMSADMVNAVTDLILGVVGSFRCSTTSRPSGFSNGFSCGTGS